MNTFFIKVRDCYKILANNYTSYVKSPFKYYVKLRVFLLNKIVNNYVLYFLYIALCIHALFGQFSQQDYELYIWITRFIICYLQITCVDIFYLYNDPINKEYLTKTFGDNYSVMNWPNKTLVFKYISPYVFLVILELFSIFLQHRYMSYLSAACTAKYIELHGENRLIWSNLVKDEFLAEQSEIINRSCQGLVSGLAYDITFVINYIMDIIRSLF